LISIDVKPYTAFVIWPVLVASVGAIAVAAVFVVYALGR